MISYQFTNSRENVNELPHRILWSLLTDNSPEDPDMSSLSEDVKQYTESE